jgi:hypothetical protein
MTQPPVSQLALALQIATLIVQILGFTGLLISISLAYLQIKKTHDWNRRKASLEVIFSITTAEMKTIRKQLLTEFGVDLADPLSNYEKSLAALDAGVRRKFNNEVDTLLNCLETVSIGIKHHILDEDICYEHVSWVLTSFWAWGEKRVHEVQQIDPTLWIECSYFANRWRARQDREISALRSPGKDPT